MAERLQALDIRKGLGDHRPDVHIASRLAQRAYHAGEDSAAK